MEEAAALLRIGRTKAYAMTRLWRATKGERGLPVVDFGSVLRVPRAALEAMVGAALTGPAPGSPPAVSEVPVEADATPAAPTTPAQATATSKRTRRRAPGTDQLDLFDRTAS